MLLFNSLDPDARVWREAKSLAFAGADVHIYALKGPGQPAHKTIDGFSVHRVTPYSPANYLAARSSIKGLVALVRELWGKSFDVYHCHDAQTLPFGFLLSRKHKASLIYDSHEFASDEYSPVALQTRARRFAVRYSLGRLAEPILIGRVSTVITVCDSLSERLKERYHLDAKPIVVRNVPKYKEPVTQNLLRTGLELQDKSKILLYQGVIARARGIERCIDLLSYLCGAVLVLLGPVEESYRKCMLERAERLRVKDRVRFMEPVPYDELHGLTSGAAIGLFLAKPDPISISLEYSLPNKVFEYVMARVPQVVADLPEIKHLVEEHEVGLSCDPNNVELLVACIQKVLDDGESNGSFRKACDKAARLLNWENEEQRLLKVYTALEKSEGAREVVRHRGDR